MDNLLLEMADEYLNIDEEKKESWKINNDNGADWCLDKIIESKIALRRLEMASNTKISQIEHNLKKETNRVNDEIAFFETKLREYFESIKKYAKDTKTQQSYKLPSGTLKMKKAALSFGYDKAKLLEYAEKEKMEDLIKTTREFKWAEFKKSLSIKDDCIISNETGEIIDIEGLKIEVKPEEFSVEV